jgi:hypothetical protein
MTVLYIFSPYILVTSKGKKTNNNKTMAVEYINLNEEELDGSY